MSPCFPWGQGGAKIGKTTFTWMSIGKIFSRTTMPEKSVFTWKLIMGRVQNQSSKGGGVSGRATIWKISFTSFHNGGKKTLLKVFSRTTSPEIFNFI
jgi:hypothetical protein